VLLNQLTERRGHYRRALAHVNEFAMWRNASCGDVATRRRWVSHRTAANAEGA